ncbi:EndoU domain-containing protein [Amycolatopsis sp. NPDC003676]
MEEGFTGGEKPGSGPGRAPSLAVGGGHRPGRGLPGKTEFPVRWSEEQIFDFVEDIARHPLDSQVVELPDGTFHLWDLRDGVQFGVVLDADGEILAAFPEWGPGVMKNPTDVEGAAAPGRPWREFFGGLETLVEAVLDRVEPWSYSVRRFFHAGEWPLCAWTIQTALARNGAALTEQDKVLLDAVLAVTGTAPSR